MIRVLQFGEGNFLRAFIEWMLQGVDNEKPGAVRITLVQPLAHGRVLDLAAQNFKYHVIAQGIVGDKPQTELERITIVDRGINPYTDFSNYLESARDEQIAVVISNTTEAGIVFNPADNQGDKPASSFPGKLTQWLFERYKYLPEKEILILPCELIEQNGDALRRIIIQYSELWNLGSVFDDFIFSKVYFYNTLVDRIVPGYPDEASNNVAREIALSDALAVQCEHYHLWVLQGDSRLEAVLPLSSLGYNVIYTDNLKNWRERKVRILNGSHTALVGVGLLAGFETVSQCASQAPVADFLRGFLFKEVLPGLNDPQRENVLTQYVQEILSRFRNPYIQHKLRDIALNTFSKLLVRVMPTLRSQTKEPVYSLTAIAAIVLLYLKRPDDFQPKDDAHVLAFFDQLRTLENTAHALECAFGDAMLWKSDFDLIKRHQIRLIELSLDIHNHGITAALQQLSALPSH